MARPLSRLIPPVLLAAGLVSTGVAVAGIAGGWGETRSVAAAPARSSHVRRADRHSVALAEHLRRHLPGQTPAEFLAALSSATRQHDVKFLLRHLHPFVVQVYSPQQCATHIRNLAPVTFTVRRVHDPAPYTWTSDGISAQVIGAIAIDVTYSSGGRSSPATVHLVPAGPSYSWFADCGKPLNH